MIWKEHNVAGRIRSTLTLRGHTRIAQTLSQSAFILSLLKLLISLS
jgi:hypothetical protein